MHGNIAVIGCGYWGRNHVRVFGELGALRVICDSSPTALAVSVTTGVGRSTHYPNVLADPEVAGVVVSTPAATHYQIAKEALIAGKDVLVEKPLALKVEDGQELVQLAGALKRILLVGHVLEYHPAIVKLKGMVDAGELGKIQYIYSNRLNLGKFRTEENILWSFAPHDIAVITLLLGGALPAKVTTHGGAYLREGIADTTVTALEFTGGVRAHIFVSWLHPFKEQRLIVVGDKAMAEFNDLGVNKLIIHRQPVEWSGQSPIPHLGQPDVVSVGQGEPLKLECQDFLCCVESREKPRVDGEKGLQVLKVLAACQQSLETGETVTLDGKTDGVFVHESSIVESPELVGKGTKVWHFSHLMPGVRTGERCVIGQNVFIGRGVVIGNGVKIENNVSVFEGVTLEDNVFCGPSCVFTNVDRPRSDRPVNRKYLPTLVKRGATIGANATVVCGHTIGRYAFVGAGSVVTKDVPDFALAHGNPAAVRGWLCQCGEDLKFDRASRARCECGRCYVHDWSNRVTESVTETTK